jgi:hypothetical protein
MAIFALNAASNFLRDFVDEIADLNFNDVASPELTVDREIEHRAVAKPPLSIQPEPDSPNLLRL